MNDIVNESLSIILPTYNRSNLLESCIDSIIDQSFSNWELIISDDGSTDNTASVIKNLSKKDKRIKYNINPKNQGLPKNRNIAVSLAQNNLVFFIEDDLILDNKCAEILVASYKKLKKEGKCVGAIAPRLITKHLRAPRELDASDNKGTSNLVSSFNRMTGCKTDNFNTVLNDVVEAANVHACSLFPKEVLIEVGGYEEKAYKGTYAYEEVDLNCRIRNKGYSLYFDSSAIAYHFMAKEGGCRPKSQFKRDCYFVRNHIIFLIRIFGIKSLYMIPFFLLKVFSIVTMDLLIRSRRCP